MGFDQWFALSIFCDLPVHGIFFDMSNYFYVLWKNNKVVSRSKNIKYYKFIFSWMGFEQWFAFSIFSNLPVMALFKS